MRLKEMDQNFRQELKALKKKYRLMKLKGFVLIVLPVFITVLIFKICKEILMMRFQSSTDRKNKRAAHKVR